MESIIETFDIDKTKSLRFNFNELTWKLRRFYKDGADISLVQSDIYREVESLLFDSNFKYISVFHYLVRLGIPLEGRLLQMILDRTYSDSEFKNEAEEAAFRVSKDFFPEAVSNVHLWWMWWIEMDILLPYKRVNTLLPYKGINIEIDSKTSPKKKKRRSERRIFLGKNFQIRSYRHVYDWTLESEEMEELCRRIRTHVWEVV